MAYATALITLMRAKDPYNKIKIYVVLHKSFYISIVYRISIFIVNLSYMNESINVLDISK